MAETVKAATNVTVEVRDALTGALVSVRKAHNLVTLAGRNGIRDGLRGTLSPAVLSDIGVGIGTTAPAAGDTALVNESVRNAISLRSVTDGTLTVQGFIGTLDANGDELAEAGLYIGDILFARATFTPVTKSSAVTVTVSWQVTFSAA